MEKLTVLSGLVAPLDRANVDTDQIIPKAYLSSIKRTGYAQGLFDAWRKDPQFVLNQPRYQGATILLARENFGCGSSREHAPWALLDLGLRAVISAEIADIFRSNALKNGLLPIVLDEAIIDELFAQPGIELRIDVASRRVTLPDDRSFAFPLDPFLQTCLLEGVDQLGYLIKQHPAITRFETARFEASRFSKTARHEHIHHEEQHHAR